MASRTTQERLSVPYFRPALNETEIAEVVECLRSGWLTTGPRTKQFEADFAKQVGAKHAIAVSSCTAALHLAVEAIGLKSSRAVLVPTMTFAATAAVVRYLGAMPILVDCDPVTLNMDLDDAERKLQQHAAGELPVDRELDVVGVIPVHVGGRMLDMGDLGRFAEAHDLWVVEDAAHALPGAYRKGPDDPWRRAGENTAAVSCFSFYANKTMTTGEGGMAVTDDDDLAARVRQMSLHGLSHDAWKRYSGGAAWDYRIAAPGYKYNMTDIVASLGLHQLARIEPMRRQREQISRFYHKALGDLEQLELPSDCPNRIHTWHLYPIRLHLDRFSVDRNTFIDSLREEGVGCSVHWRPLHLHPYYEDGFGWRSDHLPVATTQWQRSISLPIFPGMREEEMEHVVGVVRQLCVRHAKK